MHFQSDYFRRMQILLRPNKLMEMKPACVMFLYLTNILSILFLMSLTASLALKLIYTHIHGHMIFSTYSKKS